MVHEAIQFRPKRTGGFEERIVDTLERVRPAHPGGGQHHGTNQASVYSGVQAGGRETGDGKRASDRPGRPEARPHAESITALEAGSCSQDDEIELYLAASMSWLNSRSFLSQSATLNSCPIPPVSDCN